MHCQVAADVWKKEEGRPGSSRPSPGVQVLGVFSFIS